MGETNRGARVDDAMRVQDNLYQASIPSAVLPAIVYQASIPNAVIPDGCNRESILAFSGWLLPLTTCKVDERESVPRSAFIGHSLKDEVQILTGM